MSCISCQTTRDTLSSTSKLNATIKIDNGLSIRAITSSTIKADCGVFRNCSSLLKGQFNILANENVNFSLKENLSEIATGNLRGFTNATLSVYDRTFSSGSFKVRKTDKFAGYKPHFQASSKLYPIGDISFKNKLTDSDIIVQNNLGSTSNIYNNIDEGVFAGNYTQNNDIGTIVSDDNQTLIFPVYIFNSGDIQYKFRVTYPLANPKLSYLALRANAPTDQYSLRRPQIYKIYDITLEDPSGNLITKYEDISIRGDNQFTTYIAKSEINNADKPTWDQDFPYFDSGSPLFLETKPYVLTLNFSYECLQTPFNDRFDFGYEQTCIKNSLVYVEPNPFNGLRISAIEIGNSGGIGIKKDAGLNFFSQVTDQPNRVSRVLAPIEILTNNFDNGIYPQANSIWTTLINDISYNNTTKNGSNLLLNKLSTNSLSDYITLSNTSPHVDSGRLILKFGTTPKYKTSPKSTGGSFAFGGSKDFNDSNRVNYENNDEFFIIDKLELKIIAKKATGGPDYPIDVVGYSDDKLLNVTSPINGFVQNSNITNFNTNVVPDVSGFYKKNFSISDGAISDQSNYYINDITQRGDHYILSPSIVNTTTFKEYTIPLTIYEDTNKLGNTLYNSSSFFENFYLDISPIPSGASIGKVELIVYYRPSNGLMLYSLGSPSNKKAGLTNLNLFPVGGGTIHTSPRLSGILTGFTSPSYLKTNYARRWRGNVGNVLARNSFDFSEFDFSFDHEQSNVPFLTSYVDFTKIDGPDIYDHKNNYFAQATYINLLSNFGWRYSSDQLINGITTPYKSISWANNIYDSFDRALKIDSSAEMESPILNISNSFAFFIRYTPDKVDNLDLENHLILSHENSSDWAMVLVVENGYLTLKIKDSLNDVYGISDNKQISEYSFPLSILITYDSGNYNTFRLYTDDDSSKLSGSISYHTPKVLSNPITLFDHSTKYSDQLPIPMFLHEIGFSNSCNIVPVNPNKSLNQITADDFFDSYNVLANNINDDISQWHIGDFKICQFSSAFDVYTKRIGQDYITFTLNHSGSGYTQTTNKVLPLNINLSGVAYHTQIEHDFIRFEISDIPQVDKDRFFAIAPRISKTLPRGYKLNDEAISVDTIVEHDVDTELMWPDNKIGAKLIVSLYSKNQDVTLRPDRSFGLINRSIHYLEPSGCTRKLTSKFTFDNLFDNSESWHSFDNEIYNREFEERFLSKDVDDMFLQYDLVYPSGKPIKSTIKLHSVNVKLENAIGFFGDSSKEFNLFASGGYHSNNYLDCYISGWYSGIPSDINLYIHGDRFFSSGSMNLYASGGNWTNNNLNLYSITIGSIATEQLYSMDYFGSSPVKGLNLYCSGQFMDETSLPLYISPLINNIENSINLFIKKEVINYGQLNENINFITKGEPAGYDAYPFSNMSLYVQGQEFYTSINSKLNLYAKAFEPNTFYDSGSLNLFTLNYPISSSFVNYAASINWNSNNYGLNITDEDNIYAYVDADDNIRGVDLLCYGNCNSPSKCSESIVDIHGIKWYYPETCVDGGILRAKNTYTNLTFPSGSFKHTTGSEQNYVVTENNLIITSESNNSITSEQSFDSVIYDPMPYSGHFYGIRKYTGLAPNLPYVVEITGKIGSNIAIEIPTEIVEVEYNKLDDDSVGPDYNGYRISANTGYSASGDEFGKSIASKDDILAIGAPKRTVVYDSGSLPTLNLSEAGTVFLYRRNPRPAGNIDWPLNNYKSSWTLETALTLPSGMLKDYSTQEIDARVVLPDGLSAILTRWYVGQEGRQFGHSVDISVNKNQKSLGENQKEILVVGAPSAKWTPRPFEELNLSGVNIGLMIFTDEFTPEIPKPTPQNPWATINYTAVLEAIQGKDLVFNYFGTPRVKFDVKLIICQPIADSPEITPVPYPDQPPFITRKFISRNQGYLDDTEKTKKIFADMQSAFFEAFPYDSGKIHNNIPPILGLYVDNSNSLGRESLEPALDQFINFYKTYSYASGLKDFNGVTESGQVIEYVPDFNDAENWIDMSRTILDQVLDTGNLVKNNQVRFITGSVGKFNTNLGAFNVPPESGGRVYIFEKESGSWNLIQEIRSPNTTYEHPDRFGHCVSISDNGEVIAIGSPYINQAVMVFERKDEQKEALYNSIYLWVKNKYPEKYNKAIEEYEKYRDLEAAQKLYLSLDQTDKFVARLDLQIQEYQIAHTFSYDSMQPIGSWTFITDEAVPTSRLGYSVDVNEDGSMVVASSPTDSLNLSNDGDIYYGRGYYKKQYVTSYSDPLGQIPNNVSASWSSSVNAGSIHVFESRRYYPHNKVVEYGKFGNKHRNISNNTPNSPDSGHFNYLDHIFSDKNFTRTEFTDPNIPMDAGLVFIITPAEDALSDEIFDNIYDWLAMGDRNLVLVGNDPIWEKDENGNIGAYYKSNQIINKLLERLNSRMRIIPARNEYESLPNGYSTFSNAIPSFVPMGATQTYTQRLPMRCSGVGDIKIYFNYDEVMPCNEVSDCSLDGGKVQIQTKCSLPLKNYGDLRAYWKELCCKVTPKGELVPVIYDKNWPFVFESYKPDCDDVDDSDTPKPWKNFEPTPLLVAAEQVEQEFISPAIPAQYAQEPIYTTIYEGSEYFEFDDPIPDSQSIFTWDSGNSQSENVIFNSTLNSYSNELFYKPENGLIQAKAIAGIDLNSYTTKKILSDTTNYAVEHSYRENSNAKVIVIAGVETESEAALLSGGGDYNVRFYANLVSKTPNVYGQSDIAVLGGWTNHPTFADGYDKSYLRTLFLSNRNYVFEDVDTLPTLPNRLYLNDRFNIVWITNINSQPNNVELNGIKTWLKSGNKKLIITCNNTIESINNASILCGKLGIDTGTIFITHLNKEANTSAGLFKINPQHQTAGNVNRKPIDYFYANARFYPLRVGTSGIAIAYDERPVEDEIPQTDINPYWYMNPGVVKVTIPTIAGSGYRLYVTTSSDTVAENVPLILNIENASSYPKLPYPEYYTDSISELNENRELYGSKEIKTSVPFKKLESASTHTFDVQAIEGSESINLYFSAAAPRLGGDADLRPRTLKLTGVSGTFIPVSRRVSTRSIDIPTGEFKTVKILDAQEEFKSTLQLIRPISTDNSKYCKVGCEFLGGQLIEDGPVVAAQEIEIMSPFNAGVARSRITVISDSSMIQGRYMVDNGIIPSDTYSFIRSLYPETYFPYTTYGRQFNVYNKFVSPERGSPTKYFANNPHIGINTKFGGVGTVSSPINRYESKYDPKYVVRPKLPWVEEFIQDESGIKKIKDQLLNQFFSSQASSASTSKYSGIIDGTMYVDAGVRGGLPKLLKEKGYDYLDLDKVPSGYPGDLFGYSVCIRNNKILVGSPFSAFATEQITEWNDGANLKLGYDGGAGAVYMFERTEKGSGVGGKLVPWECTKKLKPYSLMGQLSGVNVLSDQFGHSISMHNDVFIIGAPSHKYNSYYDNIYESGSFARKNFNPEFDIPKRNKYDLADSGVRYSFESANIVSGILADNAGAIYVYENKISSWENKTQDWKLVEKIVSNSPRPSGERFGQSIYLSRPYRTDSDYCIFAGSYIASGNKLHSGAAYTKDIMLRGQSPSLRNDNSWISANVFGKRDINDSPTLNLKFSNSGNDTYYASGIIFTNNKGEIFIEASGQDPSTKGFIAHRPYIHSIVGYYQYGKLLDDNLPLFVSSKHIPPSSNMPLFIDVENSAYVYNTLGLYNQVKIGDISTSPSGLNLFAQCPSGISFGHLNLYSSGNGYKQDSLNLKIRGR